MGQKLKHPPVCLVLAQLKFNQVVSLSDAQLQQISARFASLGFVDFKKEQRKSVKISFSRDKVGKVEETESTARYVFGNSERNSNLVLDLDSLTTETSNYETSEAFFDLFSLALEAVHEVRTIAFYNRVGMRMIDAIQPRNGTSIADYIHPQLLGFLKLVEMPNMQYSFTQTQFGVSPQTLLVKTMQSPNGFLLPEDIAQAQDRLDFPENLIEFKRDTFMLDADSALEERGGYSRDAILSKLQTLKSELTKVFNGATTDWARSIGWN